MAPSLREQKGGTWTWTLRIAAITEKTARLATAVFWLSCDLVIKGNGESMITNHGHEAGVPNEESALAASDHSQASRGRIRCSMVVGSPAWPIRPKEEAANGSLNGYTGHVQGVMA